MAFNREEIILASSSPFRQKLFADAGIAVTAVASDVDERAAETPLLKSGTPAQDIGLVLAELKAIDVSEANSGTLVIGADQVLIFEDKMLHKATSEEEARRNLLRLAGKSHELVSSAVIARGGQTLWRGSSVAHMKMRPMSAEFIGRYLGAVEEDVRRSVGSYRYEAEGIHLFAKVEGDYHTIVGLPMLEICDELRRLEAIDG